MIRKIIKIDEDLATDADFARMHAMKEPLP